MNRVLIPPPKKINISGCVTLHHTEEGQIYAILLVRLCDLVVDFTHMYQNMRFIFL